MWFTVLAVYSLTFTHMRYCNLTIEDAGSAILLRLERLGKKTIGRKLSDRVLTRLWWQISGLIIEVHEPIRDAICDRVRNLPPG